MYRLWSYLKRTYAFWLFVIAEAMAINYYAHSTAYTRERMVDWATDVSGWTDRQFTNIGDYFRLRATNERLTERIVELENLAATEAYTYTGVKIVSNSIARTHNYFVINRGLTNGIEKDMAVLTINGAVAGYVVEVSKHYSSCLSIVNRDFKVGGQIKGKEFFGQVIWEGGDARYASMIDVPRYADIIAGDTVLTVYSSRFPTGAMIGTVSKAEPSRDGMKLDITVRLAADMARLSTVMLVSNPNAEEQSAISNQKL